MFSVCWERCLFAFQGLPVTEQGMIKAWLGEAVTLGVLRRKYLILNSSQNSLILAPFVSNADMQGVMRILGNTMHYCTDGTQIRCARVHRYKTGNEKGADRMRQLQKARENFQKNTVCS